jgi:PhnB protein
MHDGREEDDMVKPIPDGYRTITPYTTVSDVPKQLEFIQQVFNGRVTEATPDANGVIRHAEVEIGDSKLMVGQARAEWPPRPATLYVYVENVDEIYQRALDAGATTIMPPANQFYGDRHGGVTDPQGNQWWIATHVEDVSPEEMQRRAAEQMK